MVDLIQPEDLPLLHLADPIDHPDAPDRTTTHTAIPKNAVEVSTAPDYLAPNTPTAPPSIIPNGTPPHPTQPQGLTFPHGTHEGVGIGPSTMPNAGQGLYGIRPLQDAPHLFARKGQFICVYATQAQQVTAKIVKTSNSRYMWSTNTHTKFNPQAMYYDASHAPHYGKYINDLWNPAANNCELRRNPATGRVEVYAT